MKQLIKLCLFLLITHFSFAQTTIKSNDPHIHYMGRVTVNSDRAELTWSGSSASINFTGTGVKAWLETSSGTNYYKVILDGKLLPDITIDSGKHLYTLASNLPAVKHNLQLFKRTEWIFGKTWLHGFELDSNSILEKAPKSKKRKIEFYGNSITCGYGVLDTSGQDRGSAPFEDNYLSYAAITARHFNAEYSCIARSGIGVLISWFPQVMPEMYNRLDASDPNSVWDFNSYTPRVVVINLFQNDSWLVKQPQHPEFKQRFDSTAPSAEKIITAYENFVKTIRNKYPKAYIICALGNMDASREGSAWPGYVDAAVKNLKDKKITTLFFPFKNTPGHPSKPEQQAMATILIDYIEKHVKW